MVSIIRKSLYLPAVPGLHIIPAKPEKQLWELYDLLVNKRPAHVESGNLTIMACDCKGIPRHDVEFILGWADGLAYPSVDYRGRFAMKLERNYDPTLETGPYWVGFLEEGIGPEVSGFGVPRGCRYDITIIYTPCRDTNARNWNSTCS